MTGSASVCNGQPFRAISDRTVPHGHLSPDEGVQPTEAPVRTVASARDLAVAVNRALVAKGGSSGQRPPTLRRCQAFGLVKVWMP